MVLSIGLAFPAFAQDTGASARYQHIFDASSGRTYRRGSEETIYRNGTALNDTKITTKVKAAFASGKGIESNDIHVTTTAGVVTLSRTVQNSDMAARLEAIAKNTEGYEVSITICEYPAQD